MGRRASRWTWIGVALAIFVAGVVFVRTGQAPRSPGPPEDARGRSSSTAVETRADPRSPDLHPAPSPTPGRPRNAPAAPNAGRPDPAPLERVRAARADPSDEGTDLLLASLHTDDEVVVAEAADALVARRATSAIPAVARIDLHEAAGGGLSILSALGRLGALAEPGERRAAVDRLLVLLDEEKRRGAPESPGNLLQIYEALGETRDPRAAAPLEAELSDPAVGRAPKVVVVQALARIGQARSRAALAALRAREASASDPDPFEEELRRELIGAIDAAIDEL